MNILLVEPDYNNKYPPLGLMKLATYHNNKNDTVVFTKGTNEPYLDYHYIYITTLFSFHYEITINTIKYYSLKYPEANIFVGGISATIMQDKFQKDLSSNITLITGQLTSSSLLGFKDNVNIDILPPDYNILFHTNHKYTSETGYIGYTSRGCVNRCPFCAVPILEKEFIITNNIDNQVNHIKNSHMEKKDLLLLDNNILGFDASNLEAVVDGIVKLGFHKGAKFKGMSDIEMKMAELSYLLNYEVALNDRLDSLMLELTNIIKKLRHVNVDVLINMLDSTDIKKYIEQNSHDIDKIFSDLRARKRGSLRYVDFNQGMDARFLNDEKIKILSKLPIKPFRLAFDHMSQSETYINSLEIAVKHGFTHFSNYLLYNYVDSPKEMYDRLKINIDLADKHNINIHSFPMKYCDIQSTNRKNIGKNWNRHFLTNFRRILKPTMGVVGKGRSYFEHAFGKNYEEFIEILSMPADIITYRQDNKANGNYDKWKNEFYKFNKEERLSFIEKLSKDVLPESEYKNLYSFYYKIKE